MIDIKKCYNCNIIPILIAWGPEDWCDISCCDERDKKPTDRVKRVSEAGKYSIWCVTCGYGSISSFDKNQTKQWWNEQYECRKKYDDNPYS